MTNITIEEQYIGRNIIQYFHLHFLSNHISLGELLQCKAFQEAQINKEITSDNLSKKPHYFFNYGRGSADQEVGIVDAAGVFAKTLDRFEKQAFLIMVNGEQKTDLGEELEVTEDMAIQFINW